MRYYTTISLLLKACASAAFVVPTLRHAGSRTWTHLPVESGGTVLSPLYWAPADDLGHQMGQVTLVGAGPGDPDLLTVAALRELQNPDALVIADRLVSPAITSLVAGELRVARKLPGCADAAQEEIFAWCKAALISGRSVVRLKIGDPFVFGRGGEEILEFRDKLGVEPRVIPGVSSAFAAPTLGGVPVTHRGVADQVLMTTGYGKGGSIPSLPAYNQNTTAIFLMAVGRLEQLCARLAGNGYPRRCPVAVIERASCDDQRVVVGTLASISRLAAEHAIRAPATIVFGDVVAVVHGEAVAAEGGLVHPPGAGVAGSYWSAAGEGEGEPGTAGAQLGDGVAEGGGRGGVPVTIPDAALVRLQEGTPTAIAADDS